MMTKQNDGESVTFHCFFLDLEKINARYSQKRFSCNYVNAIYKEAQENVLKCISCNTYNKCQAFVRIKLEFDRKGFLDINSHIAE